MAVRVIRRFFQDLCQREPSPSAVEDVATAITNPGDPDRFALLCANIWGLLHTPMYHERMAAFCAYLRQEGQGFDAVVIQEAWFWQERESIKSAGASAGLVFSHYFSHGIGVPIWPNQSGTGLLVLSRIPIVDVIYKRFDVNGRLYRFDHMDGLAGKGCGLVRLKKPGFRLPIDVYTTHMISCYSHQAKRPHSLAEDPYRAHRIAQAYEISQFISSTRNSSLVVLAGDFNATPKSLVLKLPRFLTGLRSGIPLSEQTPTWGASENPFSERGAPAARLDHVLYRARTPVEEYVCAPGQNDRTTPSGTWHLKSCEIDPLCVTPADRSSSTGRSVVPVSDHYSIRTVFQFDRTMRKARRSSAAGNADGKEPPSGGVRSTKPTLRARTLATVRKSLEVIKLGITEAHGRRTKHIVRSFVGLGVVLALWAAFSLGLAVQDGSDSGGWLSGLAGYRTLGNCLILFLFPYITVEFLLGVFVVLDEILVMEEVAQSMQVELRKDLYSFK